MLKITFFIPEEFRLDEVFVDCRAFDRDEGHIRAVDVLVVPAGIGRFAGSGRSIDEQGGRLPDNLRSTLRIFLRSS